MLGAQLFCWFCHAAAHILTTYSGMKICHLGWQSIMYRAVRYRVNNKTNQVMIIGAVAATELRQL